MNTLKITILKCTFSIFSDNNKFRNWPKTPKECGVNGDITDG